MVCLWLWVLILVLDLCLKWINIPSIFINKSSKFKWLRLAVFVCRTVFHIEDTCKLWLCNCYIESKITILFFSVPLLSFKIWPCSWSTFFEKKSPELKYYYFSNYMCDPTQLCMVLLECSGEASGLLRRSSIRLRHFSNISLLILLQQFKFSCFIQPIMFFVSD